MITKPRIPIPIPQRGDEPGTWAYKTIASRFARTASRIPLENDFSEAIEARINDLINSIPQSAIQPIDDPGAQDNNAWGRYVIPYQGQNWHQPPWFFTEHYFYRRILQATRYFQSGDGSGIDPFRHQKSQGLVVSRTSIHIFTEKIESYLREASPNLAVIEELLYLSLWGNQADLSLWPAEGEGKPDHTDHHQALDHILVNDAGSVSEYLLQDSPKGRVDFLVDNAGFELVGDLAFSDFLLNSGLSPAIRLHLKMHPTYVSDATEVDVRETIDFLGADEHLPTSKMGERLATAIADDRLQLQSNWFWTSPLDGWEMAEPLRNEISQSNLVISKGDAHYRRLLGDRHWPFNTRFEDILAYFPAPLVALRTLKSELVAGLSEEKVKTIATQDPDWLIDGRWGMVQFFGSKV